MAVSDNSILEEFHGAGASARTAAQDGLSAGVDASRTMAKTDLRRVMALKDRFDIAAARSGLAPALLAAIASRESRCGNVLQSDGTGDGGNAFGIMQVDRRSHTIMGEPDPKSQTHINQASGILKDCLAAMIRKFPAEPPVRQLQAAVAAYNCGSTRVTSPDNADASTTGRDYSNDVWERARFYATQWSSAGRASGTPRAPKVRSRAVRAPRARSAAGRKPRGSAAGQSMPFTAKVITTAEWGAKPPLVSAFPLRTPKYVVVHHTADQNPPKDPSRGTRDGAIKFAQRIQNDHFKRGWSDSGHNFLNTTGGVVLEGRTGTLDAVKQGMCVQSAHARQDPGRLANGNDSPGIENEGTFTSFAMGDVQWASLVDLCASLCAACNVSPTNIRGHREFSNTECPGDWLFGQLPRLRQEVAAKMGIELSAAEAFGTPKVSDRFKMGDAGPMVMVIQKLLLGKGHSPGAIDGFFGENTKSAVVSFQRDIGAKATGEVDPATRKALGL